MKPDHLREEAEKQLSLAGSDLYQFNSAICIKENDKEMLSKWTQLAKLYEAMLFLHVLINRFFLQKRGLKVKVPGLAK